MSLSRQYNQVRNHTEALCTPLKTEDYGVQAAVFASPAKWHLAHTTWFFETFVLVPNLKDYKIFHPDFSFLFNSYYNNAGKRVLRANRGNITRPCVEEVYAYRQYVDKAMGLLLENELANKLENLIVLGLNHEQQHQELLLTDVKYMLGNNPLFPPYNEKTLLLNDEKNNDSDIIKIEEGVYEIGSDRKEFCYDNELGKHKAYIHNFEIANYLVTNGEFIEFMESGAYDEFNLWLDEGWTWLQENQIKAPLYWYKIDGEWHHYTLEGFKKVQINDILKHVSYYEATAFAEWKGMRLPTEFEWEVASDKLNWGKRWEWTSSAYLPYPNYKKAKGAIGEYNGKFMVNQMVLRGASIATAPHHSRSTYRNFFHADERWQFTGIRLAQ